MKGNCAIIGHFQLREIIICRVYFLRNLGWESLDAKPKHFRVSFYCLVLSRINVDRRFSVIRARNCNSSVGWNVESIGLTKLLKGGFGTSLLPVMNNYTGFPPRYNFSFFFFFITKKKKMQC